MLSRMQFHLAHDRALFQCQIGNLLKWNRLLNSVEYALADNQCLLSQHAAHVLNVLACDHAPKDEPEWNQRNCNDDECHDKRATEQPVGADTWVEGGFFENGGSWSCRR